MLLSKLQEQLKEKWDENQFPKELQQSVFKGMDDPDEYNKKDGSNWVTVPHIYFLQCVEEHMVPSCIEELQRRQDELRHDIETGVTFAFYENGGKLCWER